MLVWDKLNTHTMGSPYEVFPPAEAERPASHLEVHYTPKQGSWLDMAEVEVGCLMHNGLLAGVGSFGEMERLTAAWEANRNARARDVQWRFTVGDARGKLAGLHSKIERENSA